MYNNKKGFINFDEINFDEINFDKINFDVFSSLGSRHYRGRVGRPGSPSSFCRFYQLQEPEEADFDHQGGDHRSRQGQEGHPAPSSSWKPG